MAWASKHNLGFEVTGLRLWNLRSKKNTCGFRRICRAWGFFGIGSGFGVLEWSVLKKRPSPTLGMAGGCEELADKGFGVGSWFRLSSGD